MGRHNLELFTQLSDWMLLKLRREVTRHHLGNLKKTGVLCILLVE